MKSWWIEGGGGGLSMREIDIPAPAAGEVLIKVRAAGLNRGEFIRGHGLIAPGKAKAAGLEGAGEIIAVGEGVTRFRVGDAVMGRTTAGFAEYSTIAEGETVAKPTALSWEEAAGASLAQWVAYDMVTPEGEVRAGDWVLITGISSGVGVAAMQIAKQLGAHVIGTSGSAQKLARLAEMGLDHGIAVRGAGFAEEALRITGGKGVKLAINNVGGTAFPDALASLAYRGRLGIVGYVDNTLSALADLEAIHAKRLRVFGVSNKLRPLPERAETVAGFVRDVVPHYASGAIRPVIDHVFDFEQLPAARAAMESDTQVGKIVVKMAH
jgi:NADPH:quinone reductase-like Zn-dependent oxidoreductase